MMNTCSIFTDTFTKRTTGPRRSWTIENLTLNAVKIVLDTTSIDKETPGAVEDFNAGYLKDDNAWKYKSTNKSGYELTAKGYKEVYKKLSENAETANNQKRIWTKEEISELIQNDDRVLYGALKRLYGEQTSTEQSTQETHEKNGVGFNGVDAKFLSSVAEFLNQNGFLTTKQKEITRRKLVKYAGQLTRLANA